MPDNAKSWSTLAASVLKARPEDAFSTLPEGAEAGTPMIQPLYSVEGPWNIKDPVHECLTRRALSTARYSEANPKHPGFSNFIRGAIWNDDPECLMFDRGGAPDDFSSGITFAWVFWEARRAARLQAPGPHDRLTARSHFGDLQFLHAMGSRPGEGPEVTLEAVLRWMRFSFAIARGELGGMIRLCEVRLPGISELFPRQAGMTISELFAVHRATDGVSERAAGCLMHLLQDAFASAHVEREQGANGRRGRIKCFYTYGSQDSGLHSENDGWQCGGTEDERLARVVGAADAIEQGAELLKRLKQGKSWQRVEAWLRSGPLSLAPDARPSDGGAVYRT